MSTIGDLTRLLEQIPLWKALRALPDRVAALERRVEALEAELAARPVAESCLLCGGTLKVTDIQPDRHFGKLGLQTHTLTCEGCGKSQTRQVDPSKSGR